VKNLIDDHKPVRYEDLLHGFADKNRYEETGKQYYYIEPLLLAMLRSIQDLNETMLRIEKEMYGGSGPGRHGG
jgi:hypothetical protein